MIARAFWTQLIMTRAGAKYWSALDTVLEVKQFFRNLDQRAFLTSVLQKLCDQLSHRCSYYYHRAFASLSEPLTERFYHRVVVSCHYCREVQRLSQSCRAQFAQPRLTFNGTATLVVTRHKASECRRLGIFALFSESLNCTARAQLKV